MTLEEILPLAFAVFVLAIKPGAGMMMIMSHTISQGMKGCLSFLLGVNVVNMIFLAIVLAGFHVVDVDILFISILLKSLAAVYLIWLGIRGFQTMDVPLELEKMQVHNFFDTFSSAFMLTLSNPLVIVFYAGILPTVLDASNIDTIDIFAVAAVIIIVESVVAILYSTPLAFFRYKMSESFLKGLKIFSASMTILIGLYIGYTALPAKDVISIFG